MTWTRRLIFTMTLLGLLASNVLTLTSTAFNAALSGAMSTALGIQTVADLMSQRIASKERALLQAQTKLTNKKAAVKSFGTRLTSRTKRVAARGIAAIPAESAPYLGIAAVLAATGYELYEACESMRDLDELYASLDVTDAGTDGAIQTVCNPSLPDAQQVWADVKKRSAEWIGAVAE
jgi:hypothetical protein